MAERKKSNSSLPEDLFFTHIFLKLPAKSLLTCTCVCKSWNSFIQSPAFVSSHLNRTIDSRLCLLQRCTVPVKTGRDSFFLYSKDRDFSVRESIHFPYKQKYGFQVVASCNGLICLMKGKNHSTCCRISLNLWNPFIRKSVKLDTYRNVSALEAVGLGFDSRTSDYKLVTVNEVLGNKVALKVEMYSLKTSSWKRLPDVEAKYDDKSMNLYRPMTYLNGALYFVASREKPRSLILGFDLSEEVFHEFMLPDCMTDESSGFDIEGSARFYLFTSGGSLAVLWIRDRWMEIWVMKECGVKESWTQFSTIRLQRDPTKFTGLVLTKDACVLLSFGSSGDGGIGGMFLHDLKSQETVEIANDRKDTYMFLGDYVESLALLDKGNDLSTHFEIESRDADDTSHNNSSSTADFLYEKHNVEMNEGVADLEEDSDESSSDAGSSSESDGNMSDSSDGLSVPSD